MRQLTIGQSITNREAGSVDRYLQEIKRVALISVEEEISLAKKIHEGDESALERLVKANLRFVVSVAKQYQNRGLSLEDLINEGNLGLIKAAKKFDETKGFKFISYAVWWIRQTIIQALAEQSRTVRLPLNQLSTVSKIYKVSLKLEQELEREPTESEISDNIDMTEDKISDAISNSKYGVSLDAPFEQQESGENTLLDTLENSSPKTDEQMIHNDLSCDIMRVLNTLTEREKEILIHFFGLQGNTPMSLEELGEKFKLTRERVRQIKDKALNQLKYKPRAKLLKGYL